jgi:hypothetical protein
MIAARHWAWIAGMASSLGAAACSSTSRPMADDTHPHLDAGVPDSMGTMPDSGTGDGGGNGDGGGDGDGGGNGDAGEGGGNGDAAKAGDGGSSADGPATLAVCRQGITWSSAARVTSIAPTGFDRFGSISASTLTVAWSTSAGVIYVADRISNTGAFGTPVAIDPGAIQLANDRVALSPNGLLLIATLADGSSFATFVRSSVSAPWEPDPSITDPFHTLASILAEPGGAFSQPVESADGLSFFYLVAVGTGLPVLYESAWNATMSQWDDGTPLPNADFAITSAGQVRRPTGASADRRTLFFFDEVSGHERAAGRDSPTSPFDQFVDLPDLPEAVPSGDCVTVYFHGTDASGEGLFMATGP